MTEGDIWLSVVGTFHIEKTESIVEPAPKVVENEPRVEVEEKQTTLTAAPMARTGISAVVTSGSSQATYWCGMKSAPKHRRNGQNIDEGVYGDGGCRRCSENRGRRGGLGNLR